MSTVTVCCKLPHGLIFPLGEKRHFFKGVNRTLAAKIGITAEADFGVTEGVSKQVWDEFVKQMKDTEFMKKGMLFADEKKANVDAYAKAQAGIESGFEGLTEADMKKSSKELKVVEKD